MKIATFIVKTRVCPGDNESALRLHPRKIAKSFHTIEYASNRSFPRTRESTVPSLESRCLKAGRRQSNNFAIVLGFIQIALSAGPAPDIIALASLRSRFYP